MGVTDFSGQPMMVRFTQDRFDFQRDLYLFADHDAAALEDSVSAHAKIGPVDLGRRAEARTGAAIRVRAEPTELQGIRSLAW